MGATINNPRGGGGGGSLTDHQHTTSGDGGSTIAAVNVGASGFLDAGDPTAATGGTIRIFDAFTPGRRLAIVAKQTGMTANHTIAGPDIDGTFPLIGTATSPASVAGTIARVQLIAQVAPISTTIMMKTCPAGFYSVWAYLECTSGSGGAGTISLNLIYTDDTGSRTAPIATLPMATSNIVTSIAYPFYKASTADVNWSITGYTAGTFALRMRGMSMEA